MPLVRSSMSPVLGSGHLKINDPARHAAASSAAGKQTVGGEV